MYLYLYIYIHTVISMALILFAVSLFDHFLNLWQNPPPWGRSVQFVNAEASFVRVPSQRSCPCAQSKQYFFYISEYLILYHIVILYHIITLLYHFIPYHFIGHHIISYYIPWYYVMLWYFVYYDSMVLYITSIILFNVSGCLSYTM